MLSAIQHHFDSPDDIPAIPAGAAQFLQARTNFSYLTRVGAIDELRKAGWTEAAIYGFVEGANLVTELIELMDSAQQQRMEDMQA
ncbi:phage protein [Pseudomonas sp. B14(2017)]|uniref:phage protein n=1 Tax=Pseudomonas sp. B14(2017) TaxID=1981745 RepID=UPI000A1EA1C4